MLYCSHCRPIYVGLLWSNFMAALMRKSRGALLFSLEPRIRTHKVITKTFSHTSPTRIWINIFWILWLVDWDGILMNVQPCDFSTNGCRHHKILHASWNPNILGGISALCALCGIFSGGCWNACFMVVIVGDFHVARSVQVAWWCLTVAMGSAISDFWILAWSGIYLSQTSR